MFAGIFRTVADKTAWLWVRILAAADRLLEKIPPQKRGLVLLSAAGVFAALLFIVIGISLLTRGGSGEQEISSTGNTTSSGYALPEGNSGLQPRRQGSVIIPPDELFLPSEPDFIPGVMLEREQRTVWTAEDAAPLWQDPLKNGEQAWRDLIEKTIDDIMESIP